MGEFYLHIRWLHIAAVSCSGAWLLLRGSAALAGQDWPRASWARYLGHGIDALLLLAAFFLLAILPGAVFANGWLLVKVPLVIAYLVLATLALQGQRNRRTQTWLLVLALLIYLQIYSIARAHHPLGMLYFWLR